MVSIVITSKVLSFFCRSVWSFPFLFFPSPSSPSSASSASSLLSLFVSLCFSFPSSALLPSSLLSLSFPFFPLPFFSFSLSIPLLLLLLLLSSPPSLPCKTGPCFVLHLLFLWCILKIFNIKMTDALSKRLN